MRKLALLILICGLAVNGFSVVPAYYGARSLSLGYASTAFNYDINSIFINPSILNSVNYTLTGYQYMNSYMDYKGFGDSLKEVLDQNLSNFENLAAGDKSVLFSQLEDLFSSKAGMYGFLGNVPGFVSRGYGLSYSVVKTAVVNPESSDIFEKDIGDVTNSDIASLGMNFLGLDYKQISLSYAIEIYQSVSLGISVHYMNGKLTDSGKSLMDDVFTPDADTKTYLEHSWKSAETKFKKFVFDVGINVNLGRYFKAGVVMKNTGGAKIDTETRELELPRRIVAGLAFRPNLQWGFYMDMDIRKTDLLFNGQEMQPVSIGIEKGFFKNKFFVRAGMLNDLTEKKLFGKTSNALYGFGLGFNMRKFMVDVAIGIDSGGSVKNLAISGFILIK